MLRPVIRALGFCLPVLLMDLFSVHLTWRDPLGSEITAWTGAPVWARSVLNVKQFGAAGDGIHDDSAAILASIMAAHDRDIIFFPAGIYICNDVDVAGKNNLTLRGQGDATIIRNGIANGAAPLVTFVDVNGLAIQDLAFDNRSIGSFGGVRFYNTENVLITRTHFFDSAPLPPGSTDRYAYVFGNGGQPHQNLTITNNLIEDLQLEVDYGQGVKIQRNTLKRSVRTGAIGLFTINDGVILQDYLIDRNTIIDPIGAAIALNIDPPNNNDVTFRNIRITNNTIIFNQIPTQAIHIGPGNSSTIATGNVYDGIVIQSNLIRVATGAAAQPSESALIKFNAGPNSGLSFNNTTVAQNRIEGGGDPALGIVAMDLRYLEDSTVTANSVYNMFTVLAFNRLLNTTVEKNYVGQIGDYTVYQLDSSRGGTVFRNNYYSGPVAIPLSNTQGDESDVIIQPMYTNKRLRSLR
jgi:pectate lyase-like protein